MYLHGETHTFMQNVPPSNLDSPRHGQKNPYPKPWPTKVHSGTGGLGSLLGEIEQELDSGCS